MTTLATLVVKIVGDIAEYSAAIQKSEEMTKSFSDKAVSGLSAIGGGIVTGSIAAGAAALTGLGAAAWDAGNKMDEAMDIIRTKTGATGDALNGLEGSFKNVFSSVPVDAGLAADVIAAFNSRLEMSGPILEENSTKLLQMTNLLGGDAVTNAGLFARVIGDWSVPLDQSSGLMDKLFVASQKTGVGVDKLMTSVVQFGAPMRNMGFDLNTAIALFAKWEKEGVNAELVMGSLRIAAGKFADANIPLKQGLEDTMAAIKGAASNSEALAIAMDVFGARAAGDMSAAIREGRFNIDDLAAALGKATGAINDTTKATMDWPEKWKQFTNGLTVSLAPLGGMMMDIAGKAMDMLNAFLAKPEVQDVINKIAQKIGDIGGMAAIWAPRIEKFFQQAFEWITQNKGLIVAALAMVGAALLAFAVTSLLGSIPAIIAFVAQWGPAILILGLIGLAAWLLYTAWTENWFGIREKTAVVWAWLEPKLQAIRDWFAINIPLALQAMKDFWEQKVVPVLQSIGKWFETNIPIAIAKLQLKWSELQNTMAMVWSWIDQHLMPLFGEMGELIGLVLPAYINGWRVSILAVSPVLEVLGNFLKWEFNSNLHTLLTVLKWIGEYIEFAFNNNLLILTGIIDGVTAALQALNEWLDKVLTGFNNLTFPDWLGGSLPDFSGGPGFAPGGAGMGGTLKSGIRSGGGSNGGMQLVVQYVDNSIVSSTRENEVIDKLGPAFVEFLRQKGLL